VIHGVGKQVLGETLDGLLSGMRTAYGDRLLIRREAADHAILDRIGRPVHLFEVYWADLLRGETVKRTFDFERIFEVVWFPLLNHHSGLLSTELFPRRLVIGWTVILAPLSSLLGAGLWGAKFLAAFPTGLMRAGHETEATPTAHPSTGTFWNRVRARVDDPEAGRTLVDDLMDDVAGDVLNYIQGVANAFPVESAKNRKLARNVKEIHARFQRTAERAIEHGCLEIQVLAHSLGTVIAFNAMSPDARPAGSGDSAARITRFYTIGSPLEKIRFFWTRLVERPHEGPAICASGRLVAVAAIDETDGRSPALRWINFFSRLDLVSGRLQRFKGWPEPINRPARGLGGLITSHVAYNRNPDFLALLTEGLTGEPSQISVSLLRRFWAGLMAILETLMLPAIVLGLAATGLAMIAGAGWITGWLVSQPLEWLGLAGWAQGVRIYFVASMMFVMTFVTVLVGRGRATKLHARYWAPHCGISEDKTR
jgi:hypothetical protein